MNPKKELLIKTALELFNQRGYSETGIDLILTRSKVAKKTFYRHFESKDDLILAVLESYEVEFREWLVSEVEKKAETPQQQLLVVFDVAKDWFQQRNFYGCLMIQAAGEFPDKRTAIRKFCKQAKTHLREYLEQLASEAEVKNPVELASQLALLFEGAIVTAQVSDCPDIADDAKQAASILVRQAM